MIKSQKFLAIAFEFRKSHFLAHQVAPKKREKPQKSTSIGSKKASIKIDREEIVKYPRELLPADAQFKGDEEVIVQDIILLKPI